MSDHAAHGLTRSTRARPIALIPLFLALSVLCLCQSTQDSSISPGFALSISECALPVHPKPVRNSLPPDVVVLDLHDLFHPGTWPVSPLHFFSLATKCFTSIDCDETPKPQSGFQPSYLLSPSNSFPTFPSLGI
ncbi:hypothetical protein DFH06DRAFT_688421 [Mycena polygramma]|nr:hypothetical protein DFH06DRAFT_688421 [Mycena polygramma]